RIRDLLIFVPGLIAWQFAETSKRDRAHTSTLRANRAEHRRERGAAFTARGRHPSPKAASLGKRTAASRLASKI
ncbi:hypothetical protein BZM26_38175, partial [Paraburkholderia strydomiana]